MPTISVHHHNTYFTNESVNPRFWALEARIALFTSTIFLSFEFLHPLAAILITGFVFTKLILCPEESRSSSIFYSIFNRPPSYRRYNPPNSYIPYSPPPRRYNPPASTGWLPSFRRPKFYQPPLSNQQACLSTASNETRRRVPSPQISNPPARCETSFTPHFFRRPADRPQPFSTSSNQPSCLSTAHGEMRVRTSSPKIAKPLFSRPHRRR